MTLPVIIGLIVGALFGFGADRLAARWPLHEDGRVRGLDWRSLVVVAAGAVSLAALAARWEDPRDLAVVGIYSAALIVLLATDLDQKLLPDLITLPLIPYASAVTLLGINPLLAGKELGIASAVAAAIGAPLVLFVTDRIFRGSLGLGDLKLAVSLGLMAGLSNLFVGFLVSTVLYALVVLVLLLARRLTLRTAIPFGPALIGAGIVAALV